jgi:hypothetical protein
MVSAKLDLRKMPVAVRRGFGWLLGPMKVLHRDPYALLAQPATVLDRVAGEAKSALDRRLAEVGPEGWLRDMCGSVAHLSNDEWAKMDGQLSAHVRKERAQLSRHSAGKDLLALIDGSHAVVRNAPLLAVPDPQEHGRATLVARGRLAAIVGTRGEERARLVLDAAGITSEQVYRPYLQEIWKLVHLADGQAPPDPPKYGRLVQVLDERIRARFPSLVQPDAAHIRNAIFHGRAQYLPRRHALALHDASGWRAEMTVRELESTTERMLKLAGDVYPKAVHAFMVDAIMRRSLPVWPELVRAVVADDRAATERTAAELKKRLDEVWAEIAQLYARAATAA